MYIRQYKMIFILCDTFWNISWSRGIIPCESFGIPPKYSVRAVRSMTDQGRATATHAESREIQAEQWTGSDIEDKSNTK